MKTANRFLGVALLIALCLSFVSLLAGNYERFLGNGSLAEFVSLFDGNNDGTIGILNALTNVNKENTIPTWFSSSALLLCSVLLAGIASHIGRNGYRYATRWKVLSAIFLFLSFDEAAALHEETTAPLRSTLNTGGFLYFAWVIPGAAFVLVFALTYLRFFLDLPAKTRWLFAVAGALYVVGSLGMDMVGGYEASLHGYSTLAYAAITTLGECLEMLGVVLFCYALMRHAVALEVGAPRVSPSGRERE